MTLRASVVVPTFKRSDLLERCLAALMAQGFAPADYEVIIVDDAACNETKRQVECCARRCGHTVRYIPTYGTHGPATARNIGWRAARSEIIAFTDDDCIPERHWLKAGVAAFRDDVAAVSGRIIVPLPSVPTDYEYNAALLEHSEFATASCFYRRNVLMQVGGFDERFTVPWREDSDLFFTLLERHATCAVVPGAAVIHPVRPAPWGICLQQQRKSMFNALLYKKHPALYRQKVQAAPPWHYYSIMGALLALFIGILRRSRPLALVSLCVWLYLTGRFCAQRLHHTSHAPGHIVEMAVTSVVIPPLAIFWRLRGAITFRVFFL